MRPKPYSIVLDHGDSLTADQTAWYSPVNTVPSAINVCMYSGAKDHTSVTGIFHGQPLSAGVLGAGVTMTTDVWGPAFSHDGTSTAYIDLGAVGAGSEAFGGNNSPFTVMWMERLGASPTTFPSIARLRTTSGGFTIFRSSSTASYGTLSWGIGSSGNAVKFSGTPSLASSVGIWRHFIITSLDGMNVAAGTGTLSNYTTYCDGQSYSAGNGGSNTSGAGSNSYFGWDGADNKYKGLLDNLRIWNRVLTTSEIERLFADPWAGGRPPRRIFIPSTATSSRRSQYFFSM